MLHRYERCLSLLPLESGPRGALRGWVVGDSAPGPQIGPAAWHPPGPPPIPPAVSAPARELYHHFSKPGEVVDVVPVGEHLAIPLSEVRDEVVHAPGCVDGQPSRVDRGERLVFPVESVARMIIGPVESPVRSCPSFACAQFAPPSTETS